MSGLHHNYTTERDTFRRVEVITGVARRRRWPRSGEGADRRRELCARCERHSGCGSPRAAP
jgi:hypothetical protein